MSLLSYFAYFQLKRNLKKLKKNKDFYEILSITNDIEHRLNENKIRHLSTLARAHALLSTKNFNKCIDLIANIEQDQKFKKYLGKAFYKFLNYKASAHMKIGELDLALQSLKESLSLNPNHIGTIIELCICFLNKGDIDLSQQYISSISRSDSERYWLLRNRQATLSNTTIHPDNFSEILCKFKKSELQICSANTYRKLGKTDDARNSINNYFVAYDLEPPTWSSESPKAEEFRCNNIQFLNSIPLVTVIMTCFNSEKTISFAIESIQNQSYKNLEIIIVDDRSTDNTVSIINHYIKQDSRIKLIRNLSNVGTYVSKNKAILDSSGKYITFHDSDDWHHPVRIEKHVERLKSNKSLLGVYSCWLRLSDQGEFCQQSWLNFLHENPSSLLIDRNVFNDIGYFDSVRIAADNEFILRLTAHYGTRSIELLRQPLAIGLFHDNSLTRSGAGAYSSSIPSFARISYWNDYSSWHLDAKLNKKALRMDFPLHHRPFETTPEIFP